ncbi:hypothetical protein WR25_06677 [Diploscapter pachys]|uniref:Uncharacterized protein n=1 Tax=Diploscapter pachys TaxID=2018661 RepID=A0A2A2K0T7_9BILA|nr:hypothetical protein WR25_06677 [Diploscapter pachys]
MKAIFTHHRQNEVHIELSNEQLALLANVVANEIDQLTSQVDNWQEAEQDEGPQEVELIEIPVEVVEEAPPEPIISIVPEEVFEEAILEEAALEEAEAQQAALAAARDEAELSERIAEIASILNERAARNIHII